jgi:adenylosuccinate lyase
MKSSVHVMDSHVLGHLYLAAPYREVFCELGMIQAWLDVEVALASAQAELGLIPASASEAIRQAARVEHLDLELLEHDIERAGHALVPVLRQLATGRDEVARYIHWGATTQDILDTGLVLQLKRSYPLITTELRSLISRLCHLARDHRATVMAGRTQVRHALPITFGLKVAVWLGELVRHLDRVEQSAPRVLVGQLGGGVGTLAGFGPRGREVQQRTLSRLGLAVPVVAWHTARDSLAEFVSLAAMIGASLGKIGTEITELQRDEIGELEEPSSDESVGSSTMPHKRNPVHSQNLAGLAQLLRGAATSCLEAMQHRHERDLGCYATELVRVPEAACLLGAALARANVIFGGLVVHPVAMQRNLRAHAAEIVSERLMISLAGSVGRSEAHRLLHELMLEARRNGTTFDAVVRRDGRVGSALRAAELDQLLDPATYIGEALDLVDTMVAAAESRLGAGLPRGAR